MKDFEEFYDDVSKNKNYFDYIQLYPTTKAPSIFRSGETEKKFNKPSTDILHKSIPTTMSPNLSSSGLPELPSIESPHQKENQQSNSSIRHKRSGKTKYIIKPKKRGLALRENRYSIINFEMDPLVFVYNHHPQYKDIEVLGLFGGYIGFWLGVSMIAVFDFVETIFHAMKYWFRRNVLPKPQVKVL